MKLQISLSLLLVSLIAPKTLASSYEPNPLAVSPNGLEILGCAIEINGPPIEATLVVYRHQKGIPLPSIVEPSAEPEGTVIVLYGREGFSGRRISAKVLGNEGETALEPWGDEDWTYQAPDGTFFTARGKFNGFMVSENGMDLKALFVDNNLAYYLQCTSQMEHLKQWVQSALRFNPMP